MTEARVKVGGNCPDVAWQKLRRDKFLDEGCPVENPNIKTAVVRPISRKLAAQVIYKYEWLGTMSTTTEH